MISAIIIEDQEINREILKDMIESKLSEQLIVIGEASNVATGIALIKKLRPDLIFLDVEMPGGSGFELLEAFTDINFDIVFTTSHEDFALRAIKFSALDYLLKPIKEEELVKTIAKYFKRNNPQKNRRNPLEAFLQTMRKLNSVENEVGLPTTNGLVYVKLSEIIRCQSDNNYTTDCYFLDNSKVTIECSLREIEYLLQEAHFLRVHDSYIINLQHIKQFYKGDSNIAVMFDGTHVDISSKCEDEFRKRLDELKMIFN